MLVPKLYGNVLPPSTDNNTFTLLQAASEPLASQTISAFSPVVRDPGFVINKGPSLILLISKSSVAMAP